MGFADFFKDDHNEVVRRFAVICGRIERASMMPRDIDLPLCYSTTRVVSPTTFSLALLPTRFVLVLYLSLVSPCQLSSRIVTPHLGCPGLREARS